MNIDDIFRVTLEASIGASLIVVIVLAIQFMGKRRLSPRMLYLFWFLLIARLVMPWTPESPMSIFNFVPKMRPPIPTPIAAEALVTPTNVISYGLQPFTKIAPSNLEGYYPWPGLLTLIWVMGAGLFLTHVGYTSVRTARRFRTYQRVTDTRVNRILHACKTALGIKADASVVTHDQANGAVLFGFLRPRIAISQQRLESLADEELRHLFLHEFAHWKRRDIPIAWIATLLQAIHWFNPVVWYGFYRMRLDREIACDALALTVMSESEVRGYGHTLIKLVHRPLAFGSGASVVGMAENSSQLKRRITMISKHTSKSYRFTALGLTLLMICGCAFLTDAIGQERISDGSDGKYPYRIPIETYTTSWSAFQSGDAIQIVEVRGTALDFEEGEHYLVKGTYTLDSQPTATLHVYATGGEVESEQGPNVQHGTGTFEREFELTKNGMLHVNYYPADGGSGFGGAYFRKMSTASNAFGSQRDLSVYDTAFAFRPDSSKGSLYLEARIQNTGTETVPSFEISFYADKPDTPPMYSAVGESLAPGASREVSAPLELKQGKTTYHVRVDPNNLIEEIDESNNETAFDIEVRFDGLRQIVSAERMHGFFPAKTIP